MHTLIIGAGFSGLAIGLQAKRLGSVCATRRRVSALSQLRSAGINTVLLSVPESPDKPLTGPDVLSDAVRQELDRTTHLVVCVAPARQAPFNDPILRLLNATAVDLPQLQWIGYLSTIGVYGNHNGNWVDENTPCSSTQPRSVMRAQAERGWQALASTRDVPLSVLRLSGIYGAGRSAIDDAIAGRARMLIKPEQVFNRIHVEDLAKATLLCASRQFDGVLNITDDLPAAPQDVIRYAHRLVGKPEPVSVDFFTADISDMARSFYSENKRVRNAASKHAIGMHYQYPSYREGLDAVWQRQAGQAN